MRAHRRISTIAAVVLLAFLALLGTGTHTVARGETLAGIAARHHTSVGALASANGIRDPNRIYVGMQLTVPGSRSASPAARSRTHTVARGETLGSIASGAGTTIAAVVELNAIRNPNLIRVGQVLALPAGAAGSTAPGPAPGAPTKVQVPAGGAVDHVVRPGETIGGIARRYRISQAQLIAANGLTNGVIYAGQRLLLVPRAGSTSGGGSTATRTHTVRAGETLSTIARRYDTTISAIVAANHLADADHVTVGQRLRIGAAASPSSLVCPVRGRMRHMNDWGFPRSGGRFHEGNDLFAARGTPAVAVVSGTAVQRLGVIGGKQVMLVGSDGTTYYYTHLDGFAASGRVRAGEVIGYVGTSGNAAGGPPHIHFELHPGGGAAANPFPAVAAAC